MSARLLAKIDAPTKHVDITEGMSGHFAVIIWWNPDMGGFWEPWDTGKGRYATPVEAYLEAKAIGEAEGLPVRLQPHLERDCSVVERAWSLMESAVEARLAINKARRP